MLNINWKSNNHSKNCLYFSDLELNQPFRNAGPLSQGVVYIKVENKSGEQFMYEVYTGRLWPPTAAEVEKINVEVNIPVEKPRNYK